MPNLVRHAGMRDGKTMESVWETDGETPELMLSDSSDDGDSDSDSEQAASASRKKKFVSTSDRHHAAMAP